MKELRSYKEAFDPEKVATISNLIEELGRLNDFRTGYKLYTNEVQRCLSVGLLLAAVSVSTALLELFVRDLTVAHRVLLCHGGDTKLKGRVEREIEEDRQLGFSRMLKELEPTVVTPADALKVGKFYDHTRVPLVHALVRRLTSSGSEVEWIDDLSSDLARRSKLEDRIEDGAIADIQVVVDFMKTYQPWLLRRYGIPSG